ncbi:DUF6252 family protein [Pedobacter puniceum]|uniref:Uncharacterized protein n=1 Tax=Pedobacter puniceum TaxID=2666136 RepID=A0A7K0FKI3_9SPHI|nr:DUF6252 family protein [Pedobacter puniceum]MRX46438.1 hypothetical protein [Pedobacter puniceum]
MKNSQRLHLALALIFLVFTNMQCKKGTVLPRSKEELPAITQTGANTFGFLLNGELWLPKAPLLREKLDLTYDPTYKDGSFGIIANRYLSDTDQMELSIGLTGINKADRYFFNDNGIIYRSTKSGCYYFEDRKVSGSLIITKIDLNNKFISGTFEFKLEKDGCPTINATQGRFDLKIE